jgi:protein-tyrosine phosphatase family protein
LRAGAEEVLLLSEKENRKPTAREKKVIIDFDMLRKVSARNFRDLGGHPTREGRRVRSGMIYRSSHLAKIPEEHPLHTLGLRTLVTLQSRVEVTHLGAPDDSVLKTVRWEHIPMGDVWFEERNQDLFTREEGKEHLFLVMTLVTDWRRFYRLLAEPDVYPLLFHCSAGRDRTGVGAVMLLDLLGVEREIIVKDFLESNLVFPAAPLKPKQLVPVFEAIDNAGGARAFLRDVIGVDEKHLDEIRSRLLEG